MRLVRLKHKLVRDNLEQRLLYDRRLHKCVLVREICKKRGLGQDVCAVACCTHPHTHTITPPHSHTLTLPHSLCCMYIHHTHLHAHPPTYMPTHLHAHPPTPMYPASPPYIRQLTDPHTYPATNIHSHPIYIHVQLEALGSIPSGCPGTFSLSLFLCRFTTSCSLPPVLALQPVQLLVIMYPHSHTFSPTSLISLLDFSSSARFIFAAENPSVVQERACSLRPRLVKVTRCRQSARL